MQWRLMEISRREGGGFSGSGALLSPPSWKKKSPPMILNYFKFRSLWVARKKRIDLRFFQKGNIPTDFHLGGGGWFHGVDVPWVFQRDVPPNPP